MPFSDRLRSLREKAHLEKKELSDKLGMPYNTYRNYEIGLREPNYQTLVRIADFFQVSLDYLLDRMHPVKTVSGQSGQEELLLKKYRALDGHGKGAVHAVLDYEYQLRTKVSGFLEEEDGAEPWKAYLGERIAARGGVLQAGERMAQNTQKLKENLLSGRAEKKGK